MWVQEGRKEITMASMYDMCILLLSILICSGSTGHTVTVNESGPVTLPCNTSGRTFQGWYKMTSGLKPTPRQIATSDRIRIQGGTLYFTYVESDDAGEYKCTVSEPKTLVFVHTVHLKVTMTTGGNQVKPQLQFISPSTRVRQGHQLQVIISCIFSGRPIPEITWYHRGREIATGVSGVSSKGEGNYTCVGKNTAGQDTGSMDLTVIPLTTSAPLTHHISTSIRGTPPHPSNTDNILPTAAAEAAITSGCSDPYSIMAPLVYLLLLTVQRWL